MWMRQEKVGLSKTLFWIFTGLGVFPSRVVPALGRVRVRPQPPIFEAPTPPCSERPEYLIVESGVQTDDVSFVFS